MIVIKNETLRRVVRFALPFGVIPAVVIAGALVFHEKQWAFICLAVAVLTVVLFISGFEKKQVGSRRLVIVAVMTALSAAGRFIPLFKPVTALTVMTALYFGGEAGFMVGAMTALVSGFFFGMGPWTPFQMLAWGMTGLIAGFLRAPLKKNRVLLALYGVFSGVAFSLTMDVWTVTWYNGALDFRMYLAALTAAAPFTLLYCVSNAVFLWLIAVPVGKKLERAVVKYGM